MLELTTPAVPTRICSVEGCGRKHSGLGYCKRHYRRFVATGDPLGSIARPTLAERFWPRVDRSGGPNACWLWTGPTLRDGYGSVRGKNGTTRAHCVAFSLARGSIPDGLCVCHSCDNPPCCNPAHLWLGTQAENVADMDRKGRRVMATGDRNGSRRHPERRPRGDDHWTRRRPESLARGDRHGNSRLTASDIPEIRAASAAGETYLSIAARFGVGKSTIGRVVRREYWRHVDA